MRYEIVDKGGMPYVMVPQADYDQLFEDAETRADNEAYDESVENPGEIIPGEVYHRIVLGDEHPVKIYREYRELTQEVLAKKANISRAFLAQIEGKKRTGSAKVLKALAAALDLTIDEIM